MAHKAFNDAKHMNYELLKYAMELVDKQEKREEKLKKKLESEKDNSRSSLSSMLGFGFDVSWLWNLFLFFFLVAVWIVFRDDLYFYLNRQHFRNK